MKENNADIKSTTESEESRIIREGKAKAFGESWYKYTFNPFKEKALEYQTIVNNEESEKTEINWKNGSLYKLIQTISSIELPEVMNGDFHRMIGKDKIKVMRQEDPTFVYCVPADCAKDNKPHYFYWKAGDKNDMTDEGRMINWRESVLCPKVIIRVLEVSFESTNVHNEFER